MSAASAPTAGLNRAARTERALFRGATLTMADSAYRDSVEGVVRTLLAGDGAERDLTAEALELIRARTAAEIVAGEAGVAAGLEEFAFLLRNARIEMWPLVKDGDTFEAGEVLAKLSGDQLDLLSTERVGLNLLQRMCGIATAARRMQQLAASRNPETRVVGTRKTPWGLLGKRALHWGGVGTHRISLADAILVKNNHLKLIADREEEAAPAAAMLAWKHRKDAAFIEVEVRGMTAALAVAETFQRLRDNGEETYPCLIMLDNMTPQEIARVIGALREKSLWDHVLIEASGGVTESNIEEYATSGADAISVGALTHSPRALDLSQRIS